LSDPATPAPPRLRLDLALVELGFCESRARAQSLILSGRVAVDGAVADKCGAIVRAGQAVTVKEARRPFASRAGEKLDGAIGELGVEVEGAVALDVGASTGGFTDCLLRRGARKVYAVDVGERLIDDRLRNDPRVVVLERVNFRHAKPDLLPEKATLATVDVSFISLRHILPPLAPLLSPGARVLAMVKPQFEVGRGSVGKGGVVRDDALREAAVDGVAAFASEIGFRVLGRAESRVAGPKGNREVFLLLGSGGAEERA
jgi:23S rRNA (cytidine1920-2'-O)/16S rRNA (cytidine1409-2'-O)-methyltransferase